MRFCSHALTICLHPFIHRCFKYGSKCGSRYESKRLLSYLSCVYVVNSILILLVQTRELEKYPSLHAFIREVAVPEMQIKLRQGFGRAIRTESDTCVIAILDERACRGRRYAQAVSEALPEMRRTGSLREVTRFLREKKPESYFEVER